MPVLLGKMGGLQHIRASGYRLAKLLLCSTALKNLRQKRDDCLFG